MADDEERTSSDSEAEAIEAAVEDSDEDVRYSLRSKRGSKLPTTSASTSMGVAEDVVGRSQAGTDATRGSEADPVNLLEDQTQGADARSRPSTTRVARDVTSEDLNADVEGGRTGRRTPWHSALVGQDLIEGSPTRNERVAQSAFTTQTEGA